MSVSMEYKSVKHNTSKRVSCLSDNIGDHMLIMLILFQDLLKFQIIPINFPYKVLTYTVSTDVLESIKHNFSDVLTDRLNPTPMKRRCQAAESSSRHKSA